MAKILIAGDFCPRDRVAAALEKGEFASVLEEVRELTARADYSILNFECPVVTGGARPIEKNGPNLRCTLNGVNAIKYAGFDCVTLANNHFLDYGGEGVKETINTLDAQGIDHVGGGLSISEASKVLYKEVAGLKLAIINCCENEFSIATENTAGSNPLNTVHQYYSIQEARCHADRVLVIVHGGHEHFQLPSPRMVENYRFFIDAGADAVINHHQHCFSGYEVYKGKPIFYGLGNFCFDLPSKRSGIWTEGYMVMIDLEGQTPSFKILPFSQCAEKPRVVMLMQNAYSDRLNELNVIIANSKELQSRVEEYYASCTDQYSSIFEPIRNRYYLGAKHRGWLPSLISKKRKVIAANFILCEAHRDKLMHYLTKNK